MNTARMNVRLESVTPFDRVNLHTLQPITESFFAITMRGADDTLYVNYTRQDTAFGVFCYAATVGQILTVGFTLGEFRNDEHGPHYKVTRVQVGGYASASREALKETKRAKRLAKLGL